MKQDMINKLDFDFTCNSEEVACSVQQTFVNDTMIHMGRVMDRTLKKFNVDHLHIDRIEVDLGDVMLSPEGWQELLRKFEEQFAQQMNRWRNSVVHATAAGATPVQGDWEFVTTWLLSGDVPWWIDKNIPAVTNEILQRVIKGQPEQLQRFLTEHATHPGLSERLVVHVSASTRKLLLPLLPETGTFSLPDNLRPKALLPVSTSHALQLLAQSIIQQTNDQPDVNKHFHASAVKALGGKRGYRKDAEKLLHDEAFVGYKTFALLLKNESPAAISFPSSLAAEYRQLSVGWAAARIALAKFLTSLTPAQAAIVYRIINDGRCMLPSERALGHKMLAALPADAIKSVMVMLQLPAQQWQAWIPENLVDTEQQVPAGSIIRTIVSNGGLCLVAPYLPALFRRINYLQGNQFKNRSYAMRAVYLLAYLSFGARTVPEYALQLNKILCGLDASAPLTKKRRLVKEEKAAADELLQAIIQNWTALKQTSIEGLRGSFLQRKAIITAAEAGWLMQVEKKGFDVLLDSIPWTFTTIKLPWMKSMLQVEW